MPWPGSFMAVITRRAEFAGLAAPALLLLADLAVRPARRSWPCALSLRGPPAWWRAMSAALDVEIHGQEPFDARLLHPSPPARVLAGGAVDAPGGQPIRTAVLRVVPTRWGSTLVGVLDNHLAPTATG